MKKYLTLFTILALALALSAQVARGEDNVCSQEAKICPDGSSVGKTGPNCSFAACPGSTIGQHDGETDAEKSKSVLQEKREAMRAEIEKKKGELKTNIEGLRADAKAKMEALRAQIKTEKDVAKAKIKELRVVGREQALGRFDDAVARMSVLEDKISAVADKLDVKGVDVTAARGFIKDAGTKLSDAKDKIAEINSLLATSINELSLADKTKLRTLAQDTQALIKEAHALLQNAVQSLKDGVKAKMETKNTDKTDTGKTTGVSGDNSGENNDANDNQ